MRFMRYLMVFSLFLFFSQFTDAQVISKKVTHVSFITTENGTRIEFKVSGPVQLARKNLKGFVAFTISPALYAAETQQIKIQNQFAEFIYAVQRTPEDVYILIKLTKGDEIVKLSNDSGQGKILVEILNRPNQYPTAPAEKPIPAEQLGAPYTPESELSE